MKNKALLFTLIFFLFSFLPAPRAAQAQDIQATLPAFGYTWDSSLAFATYWKDIHTTGTPVYFFSADDAYSSPIDIGFTFKYFENTYTQLQVSTNGFISFDALNQSYPANSAIPRDYIPNNIVATFWDDLKIFDTNNPNGAVYIQTFGNSPSRYTVIEWYSVTRFGAPSSETLTFELILQESGNILFGYKTLNGVLNSATVGMEDADGVDGLLHIYNAAGLANSQMFRANYPAAGARLKVFPRYISGFAQNYSVTLPFTLKNTGTIAQGYTFGALFQTGDPTWMVSFETALGQPIGSITTLEPNEEIDLRVRMSVANSAQPGNFSRWRIRFTSTLNKTFDIYVQGAVPAPFAQAFIDSGDGYVQFVTPTQTASRRIFNTFTGATINLQRVGNMDYLLNWEIFETYPLAYININTASFDATNSRVQTTHVNDDHSDDGVSITDTAPIMSITPNENAGMGFIRSQLEGLTQRTNVYFAPLDLEGHLTADMVNITQNTELLTYDRFRNPSVTATGDNRFAVVWENITQAGPSDQYKDIQLAILDANGNMLYGPQSITDSQNSSRDYSLPNVVYLGSNRIGVAYFYQGADLITRVGYAIRGTNGTPIGDDEYDMPIFSSDNTGNLTASPLLDGKWAIAWINDAVETVLYAVLDDAGTVVINPTPIPALDGRAPADIASTYDNSGNAVFTWRDNASDYLYYALIGSAGEVKTSPMSFRRGRDPLDPNIFSSTTGGGLSTCPDLLIWEFNMPVIQR